MDFSYFPRLEYLYLFWKFLFRHTLVRMCDNVENNEIQKISFHRRNDNETRLNSCHGRAQLSSDLDVKLLKQQEHARQL